MNKIKKHCFVILRVIIYSIFIYIFDQYFIGIINNNYNFILQFIYIILISVIIDSISSELFNFYRYSIYIYFSCYIVFLLWTLFCRSSLSNQIADPSYIIKWIKLLFHNKIVFYNLIGNIIIFIPLGFYLHKFKIRFITVVLLSILIPSLIEIIQYYTNRGVLDYIDIILNTIGIILGHLLLPIRGEPYEKRRQRK